MTVNKIAELFAELGFRVNDKGLKKFRSELQTLSKDFDSSKGVTGSTDRARKSSKRFLAEIQKNYTKLRPSLQQMHKDLKKVEKEMDKGLSPKKQKQAYDLQQRIMRDIRKEQDKTAKNAEVAQKRKQDALTRTRNKLVQVTRKYDAHAAKLMQVEDAINDVNSAYKRGHITQERQQQMVRKLTAEYERLADAQRAAQTTGRVGAAGGIYAGGQDPRQAGSHRLISAIHSDAGLGAIVGGVAAVQSVAAYQNFIAMEQGLTAATGSVERAGEEMEFLTSLSNKLGLFIGDLGRSFSGFAAAARGSTLTSQEVRDTFEGVASQARVLNLSAADTEGVMRALTQMMNKSTVMAEELDIRLAA